MKEAEGPGVFEVPCLTCRKHPHVDHLVCGICTKQIVPKAGENYCSYCGNKLRDLTGNLIIRNATTLEQCGEAK